MSLWNKVKNIFRSARDKAEESLSDIERDSKYDIVDAKKQISDFQAKIARIMSQNKLTIKDRDAAQSEVEKLEKLAARAAKAQNVDDVRELVEKKGAAQRNFETLNRQVEQNQKVIDSLRAQLNKRRAEVATAESNRTRLLAQHEGAKIRKEMATAASDMESSSPLSRLQELERKVNEAEADAEVAEELVGAEDTTSTLEEKYSESTSGVDDEVERLMREARGE